MARRPGMVLVLSLVLGLGSLGGGSGAVRASVAASRGVTSSGSIAAHASLQQAVASLPISFEPNAGQVASQVRFLAHGPGSALFLASSGMVLSVDGSAAATTVARPSVAASAGWRRADRTEGSRSMREVAAREGRAPSFPGSLAASEGAPVRARSSTHETILTLRFLGANPHPRIMGLEKLPGRVNYFVGNDPTRWHTDIPTYAQVEYQNLYPGIDLVFYGRQGHLEYDWVVRPGANPTLIRLGIEGAGGVRIDRGGNLELGEGKTAVHQLRPLVYQQIGAGRRVIESRYLLVHGQEVGVQVGRYDRRLSLVVDPILVYSTYLGGTNADKGNGIAVDSSGHAYITGDTLSTNFPTSPGAFQTANGGFRNAFITKLDTNASGAASLVYSTYLGGGSAFGNAITIDGAGEAFVTGLTNGVTFPTTRGAFQPNNPQPPTATATHGHAFVTKLSAAGDQLVYSTYLGGTTYDFGFGIAVDGSGNAYVTGETRSTDFPTKNPYQAHLKVNPQITDTGYITKLNPSGSGLVYSTYLGGSSGEGGASIKVDAAGDAYVTGSTGSTDFPTTPNAYQPKSAGGEEAFVTEFDPSGTHLLYSTFLGGASNDFGAGIALDSGGVAYIAGWTNSSNFPTTPTAYRPSSIGGFPDAFVAKLDTTILGAAGLLYSTYLGGSSNDQATSIAVDASGDAYVAGFTQSTDFPTANTNHTQNSNQQQADTAFVSEFDPAGKSLLFSTYLGGSYEDEAYGIAVEPAGDIYVTGQTFSSDFPTVNAYQTTLDKGAGACDGPCGDAFVTKFTPSPTAARVARFTVHRASRGVLFRWRMAVASGVAGFNLYARSHRLNRRLIPAHRSRTYTARASWQGRGPFTLHVLLSDGGEISVRPG